MPRRRRSFEEEEEEEEGRLWQRARQEQPEEGAADSDDDDDDDAWIQDMERALEQRDIAAVRRLLQTMLEAAEAADDPQATELLSNLAQAADRGDFDAIMRIMTNTAEGAEAAQPTGRAFQVHNKFNDIDFVALFRDLCNLNLDVYPKDPSSFRSYLSAQLFLLAKKHPDSKLLLQQLGQLTDKIAVLSFSQDTNLKNIPNATPINAVYTILNFVKKQPKKFQNNYIKFFLDDSCNAYEGTADNTSCVKGIEERLYFALAQAGVDDGSNPLYQKLAQDIFPPTKLSKEALNHFGQMCYTSVQDSLASMPKDKRIETVRSCIRKKVSDMGSINMSVAEGQIDGFMKETDMMYDDDMLGGRRRTRRRRSQRAGRRRRKTCRRRMKKRM